jgi:hypothetical protein
VTKRMTVGFIRSSFCLPRESLLCKVSKILLVCSFAHVFVCSFVRLFMCSFVRLFMCSSVHVFVYSFVRLFMCSSVHVFVCSFVRLFICSSIRSTVCQLDKLPSNFSNSSISTSPPNLLSTLSILQPHTSLPNQPQDEFFSRHRDRNLF